MLISFLSLSLMGLAQENTPVSFDHGNNNTYTPYDGFVKPVAAPSPLGQDVDLPIANTEKDIATKKVNGANSGIHFPEGTPGVKTVRYDLYVTDTTVNFTGKKKSAYAVNGQLIAPTLSFTVGDTAVIYVHNYSKEPSSFHWHGVQLPSRMDGVPFLTQKPIPPKTTYIYKFPVVQSGTYWYHSHYMLQEQLGLFGALIFNKRTEPEIPTIPVVLSDWSDTAPEEIQRMLHTGNDWFGIKKHSTQSYWEALKANKLGVKLTNEWKRMEAMDISDVYYERFLVNGDTTRAFSKFKSGDKVRLRLVNGGSSSYFWLKYSGGKITVVANDGNDVKPVAVDRLIVGPSETYDLVVTIPENKQFEFLATAEDRSGSASLWLGKGEKVPAKKLPKLNYFAGMKMMNDMMKMNGDMEAMGMKMSLQEMDMNQVMYPELDETASKGHNMHDMGDMDHSMQKKDHKDQVKHHHEEEMPHKMNHGGKDKHKQRGTPEPEAKHQEDHEHDNSKSMKHKEAHHAEQKEDAAPKKEKKTDYKGGHAVMSEHHGNGKVPHEQHDSDDLVTLNYNMLEATKNTTLPKQDSVRTLKFELTGNMNRYVWSLNNKTVEESDKILIRQGENLRIVLENNTMMRHPMHLHGHDFRVLNQYGKRSPMKNVLDIMPMETDTIEFNASESGDWFFHCHILYHMAAGMGRIFEYEDSPENPEITDEGYADKMLNKGAQKFYGFVENDFAYNSNVGSLRLDNTRWGAKANWRLGYKDEDGYEVDAKFGHYFGNKQWLFPYVGANWAYQRGSFGQENWFGQSFHHERRARVRIGLQYTLPGLVVADAGIDHKGHVLLEFSREDIPLANRLRGAFMVNSDREYRLGLQYIIFKNFAISGNYDSDYGWGAGISVRY